MKHRHAPIKATVMVVSIVLMTIGPIHSALAQFATTSLRSGSSSYAGTGESRSNLATAGQQQVRICNVGLLPPGDALGPWDFMFCDASGAQVRRCQVFAKSYIAQALDASALRARVISAALSAAAGRMVGEEFTISCR